MSIGVANREDRILPPKAELHVEKYLEDDDPVVVDMKLIIERVEIITEPVDWEELPSNNNVM